MTTRRRPHRGSAGWSIPAAWRALGTAALALLFGSLCARPVAAQDKPPYLLHEPGEYTDVIDAFEPDDPIDVNVALSFARNYHAARIEREVIEQSDRGGGRFLHIADSTQVTNALAVEFAVGLWRDLMAYARLPLVLSDTRQLRPPDSARCQSEACLEQREQIDRALGVDDPNTQTPLFNPKYDSATRSGVGAIDLGVAWGIVNQFRTPWLPTWVVSLETRIGVGTIMNACADQTTCSTGINRGTVRIELATRWSYRLRYLEP